MKIFLEYLEHNTEADFRNERITQLKRSIDSHERKSKTKQLDEENHLNAGLEYVKLTKKWEEVGAYWKPLGSIITKWYYNGECFFTWYSGANAIEHLISAQDADTELSRLIHKDVNAECECKACYLPKNLCKCYEEFLQTYTCEWS